MTRALPHLPSVETRDVSPWIVIIGVLSLLATLLACTAGAIWIAFWLGGSHDAVPPFARKDFGIGLEVDPPTVQASMQAKARGRLAGYGWNDRQRKRAHVPVTRAMDILAAHGWPDAEEGR